MVNLARALVAASFGVAGVTAGPLAPRTVTVTSYTATKTVTKGGPTVTSGFYTVEEWTASTTTTKVADCTANVWLTGKNNKREAEPTVTVTTDKTVTETATDVCTVEVLVTTVTIPGTTTIVQTRCSKTLTSSYTTPATWTTTSTKYGTYTWVTSTTKYYITVDGTRYIYPPDPPTRQPEGPQQPKPTIPANPPLPSDAWKTATDATSVVYTLATSTIVTSVPVQSITTWVYDNPTVTTTQIYYETTVTPVIRVTLPATTCDRTTPLDPCRFAIAAPTAGAPVLADHVVTATVEEANAGKFGIAAAAAATPITSLRTYTVIVMRGNTVTGTVPTTWTYYTCPPKTTST